VEDLFGYAAANPRPSGIQRLAFEMYAALRTRDAPGRRVRFLRHHLGAASFRVVAWDDVAALFDAMAERAPLPPDEPPRGLIGRAVRAGLRRLTRRKPETDPPFDAEAGPGDVLLMLGATWATPDYGARIARARARHRLRTALLVYDIIPLRRPDWCPARLAAQFRIWFDGLAGQCDTIFTISEATAADLLAYAAERRIELPLPVRPIPIGSGFAGARAGGVARGDDPVRPPPLGEYVLLVATIEARKNHALMLAVWRRLVREMAPRTVPLLVFVGRAGWQAEGLMRDIAADGFLGGRIVILPDPSDAELRVLYAGCLFTVFPSLFEGWGLPVTESLAFGKACLCSNTTSLPEAGGTLARYFDPHSADDAYEAVRAVLDDRAGLAAWEARVRREFRPVPWRASVDALLAGLAA
jgi:glycosyltransferase involved in cell wall biosynthesis